MAELLPEVVRALQVSQSPNAPSSVRQEALAFIEGVKQSSQQGFAVLHMVLQSGEEWPVKQMALGLLNDWLRLWWNRLEDSNRDLIKGVLGQLLLDDALGCSPHRPLRTKLSVCIANVAERQFPQLWPSFLEEMLRVWQTSPLGRQDVVISTFETMIVDCVDTDFNSSLPSTRRQEIIAGFKLQLEPLLSTAFASLTDNLVKYQQFAPGSAERTAVLDVACATLKLVRAFVQFKKADETCQDPHDFSKLALGMLSMPGLQNDAATLLAAMTSQDKMSLELFGKLLQSVPAHPMSSPPDSLCDCLAFQRQYAEGVFSLLGQNAQVAFEKQFLAMPGAPQLLCQYVTFMTQVLSASPSRRLADDALKHWHKIYRSLPDQQHPQPQSPNSPLSWMSQLSDHLLGVYLTKAVCRGKREWENLSADADADAAEFDDYEEYTEFMDKNLGASVRMLVELVAKKFPSVAVAFVLRAVQDLVVRSAAAAGGGTAGAVALVGREWEPAINTFVNIVLRAVPLVDGDAVVASSIVDTLLQWSPESALAKYRAKGIIASAPVLKRSPAHLSAAFASLFQLLASDSPEARSRAAAAISQLCDRCGSEIIASPEGLGASLLPKLLQLVDHPQLTAHEKASLRDSIVALSAGVQDGTERGRILVAALGGLVETWKQLSAPGNGPLTTPQGLVQQSFNGGAAGGLSGIITMLNSILTATKKSSPPTLPEEVWTSSMSYTYDQLASVLSCAPVWQAVLPGIVAVTQALHAVWSQAFREQFAAAMSNPYDAQLLFAPGATELARWSGQVPSPSASHHPTDLKGAAAASEALPESSPLQIVRRELLELRSTLYQLLGQACLHKVLYAFPDMLGALLSDMAAAASPAAAPATGMENAHLSILTARFVEPLVLNAPPFTYPVAVAAFLAHFFQVGLARMALAWDRSSSTVADSAAAGAAVAQTTPEQLAFRLCGLPAGSACPPLSAEQVDLARDKLIADMTKTFADSVGSIGLVRSFLSEVSPALAAATIRAWASSCEHTTSGASSSSSSSGGGGGGGSSGGGSSGSTSHFLGASSNDDQRERHKSTRRAAITYLVMGRSGDGSVMASPVTKPFVESVVALLCIPDANACKIGVSLAKSLAEQSAIDARLLGPVGRDAFSAALLVLLRAESFSAGLEWSLVEFLQEVYCAYVLGFPLAGATDPAAAGGAGGAPVAPTGLSVCTLPRDVLMQVPGNSVDDVRALEQALISSQSKKKRKDLFRDHVAAVAERIKVANGGGAQSSDLRVLDIRSRFLGSKKHGGTNGNGAGGQRDAFDISSLFA